MRFFNYSDFPRFDNLGKQNEIFSGHPDLDKGAFRDSGSPIQAPAIGCDNSFGTLITTERLKILRDNGIREIRFDLSAVDYALDGLKKAVGVIPIVTVEIPAIPEDMEKIKLLLKKLADLGVNYLNLHQIRCTHFNLPKLIRRGYTFLHGPGVAVLETELAALELIRHSLDQRHR